MKTYAFFDRRSKEYMLEVKAETKDEACDKADNMSFTELVIRTAGTGEGPDDFQYRVRNSIVKELP